MQPDSVKMSIRFFSFTKLCMNLFPRLGILQECGTQLVVVCGTAYCSNLAGSCQFSFRQSRLSGLRSVTVQVSAEYGGARGLRPGESVFVQGGHVMRNDDWRLIRKHQRQVVTGERAGLDWRLQNQHWGVVKLGVFDRLSGCHAGEPRGRTPIQENSGECTP